MGVKAFETRFQNVVLTVWLQSQKDRFLGLEDVLDGVFLHRRLLFYLKELFIDFWHGRIIYARPRANNAHKARVMIHTETFRLVLLVPAGHVVLHHIGVHS